MRKRSLTIAGHRTSIALEPEFWDALETMAEGRGLTVAQLLGEIDQARSGDNLSSSVRIAVLAHFRRQY